MTRDHILFHNVGEMAPADGGMLLQRVPEATRQGMEEGGQMRAQQAANTELRFVPEEPVRVTLSAPDGPILMREFRGDMPIFARHDIDPEPTVVTINPEFGWLPQAAERPELRGAFHPNVVRLAAGGAQPASRLVYHSIEGKHRLPKPDELAPKTMLAYGTSITQGFNASQPHLTWPAVAARELQWDVINLGMGGACMCEKSIADYIAERGDWDLAVLSVSVNMSGRSYDEFRERVGYLVRTVVEKNPGKPVVGVTLYPFNRDLGFGTLDSTENAGDPETYRQILRDIVSEVGGPDLHLLEGPEILTRYTDLAVDILHPSDYGLIAIGQGIARGIAGLISG